VEVPDEIVRHYQSIDEGQRITVGFGQLEFRRVQEIVRRHLPPGRLRILDVGGATGVHAEWLAADGHDVCVIDPVPDHVEAANALPVLGGSVTAEVGDARRLSQPDGSVDAVLVFGPLYHLTERADRVGALREATRVVRDGGLVFVAAISRFASLFDGLAREFLFDREFRTVVERDLATGRHANPDEREHWFTTAYFHHPDELQAEVTAAGLSVIEVVGVEGMAGWLRGLAPRWEASDDDREVMLFAARAIESEPSLLGLSAHLVLVARKEIDPSRR
jgi:SAM-dependent methyltransferase